MDEGFFGVPPLKRFKLLQQSSSGSPSILAQTCLPAKKRIESRSLISTAVFLPAKKRVWAPSPDFGPFDVTGGEGGGQSQEKKQAGAGIPNLNEPGEQSSAENKGKGQDEEEEEDGIVCCICNSTDGNPSDPIVFCDGCDLTVHATCYGDPLIRAVPDGDWFCAKCDLGERGSVDASCCLCPVEGGATKPTVDGRWAHILCGLLVPEVFFRDPKGREGIDCSRVPQKRWKGCCYLCGSSKGCAIECSEPKCSLAFHVGCGMKEDLCIEYREGRGGAIVASFCKAHTQLWEKQQQSGKFKIVAREQKSDGKKKAR